MNEEIMKISEILTQNQKLLREMKRLLSKEDFVIVKNKRNKNLIMSFKIIKNVEEEGYTIVHNIKYKARYVFRIKNLEELFELGVNEFYTIECSGCEEIKNLNDKSILRREIFI